MFAQVSALLAIYFVMWWIVLFATLPFGVSNTAEAGEDAEAVPGADPGAPVAAMLVRKALWTTIISGVIFTVALIAYRNGFLGIDRLAKLMGVPL